MNQYSPKMSLDISRELLNYSNLDESFVRPKRIHQSPRMLFEGDEEKDEIEDITEELNPIYVSFEVVATTPSK